MKKPSAGAPFRPNARDWSKFVDSAKRSRESTFDQHADLELPEDSQTKILVKNNSAVAQSRFAVLAIGDPWKTPTADAGQFKRQIVMLGDEPGVYHDAPKAAICVLLEPLQPGDVGEAVRFGLSIVEIDVTDTSHVYADLTEESTSHLTSAPTSHAAARIIWKESGIGVVWAIVELVAPESFDLYIAKTPRGGIPPRKLLRPGQKVCAIWKLVPIVPGSIHAVLAKELNADGSEKTQRIYNLSAEKVTAGFVRVDQSRQGYWLVDCPCGGEYVSSSSSSSSSEPSSSEPSSSEPSSSSDPESSSGGSSISESSSYYDSSSSDDYDDPPPGSCTCFYATCCMYQGGSHVNYANPDPPCDYADTELEQWWCNDGYAGGTMCGAAKPCSYNLAPGGFEGDTRSVPCIGAVPGDCFS